MVNCRGCGDEINEGIEMFIHNYKEHCDKDSVIEFIEQDSRGKD